MSDALTTLGNLRRCGWSVAVHNDYKIGKKSFTFWLMTREDGVFLKGEGKTDGIALDHIVAQLREMNDAEDRECRCGLPKSPKKALCGVCGYRR